MAGEGVDDEMQDRLPNLVSLLHRAGAWEGKRSLAQLV
jgi:hypothetical protein